MPLYAFGSNGSGQLGINHTEDVSTPQKCKFEDFDNPPNTKITRLAAGGNHTLVLFEDGAVHAAGSSGLELDDEKEGKFRRVVVDGVDRFRDVSATWEGTFLVGRAGGAVYVLGSGGKGELGLGEGRGRIGDGDVGKIDGFPSAVVSIASGMGHTVVVLSNGEVYGWGGARKGQLGDAAKEGKIVWAPVKVGVPFSATGATCGREFTVIMGDKNAGEFVVLGSADDKWKIRSGVPAPGILSSGYASVAASWHGVYVHLKDSSVVAWGRNDRGQLPPTEMRVKQLAVGSEHVLGLLDDGTVVAFGWGEHGNCGPDTDDRGNVEYGTVSLPGGTVVGIGAGCATSWIITT